MRTISKTKPQVSGQNIEQEWLFQMTPYMAPKTYRAIVRYDGSYESQSYATLFAINLEAGTQVVVASRNPQKDYGIEHGLCYRKEGVPDDVFDVIFDDFGQIAQGLQPA